MENNIVLKEMIVKCPYSGENVNIAPMLFSLNELGGAKEVADSLLYFMENLIVFSNEEVLTNVVSINSNQSFYHLTLMRRALRCMEPGNYSQKDLEVVFD